MNRTAVAALIGVVASVAGALPASAAEPAGPSVTSINVTAAELRAAAQNPVTRVARERARDAYVSAQSRAGRLVDEVATSAAVVDGLSTVWERGVTVANLQVRSARMPGETEPLAEDFLVESGGDPVAAAASAESSAVGVGLSGAYGVSYGNRLAGSCITTTSGTGNKLTNCYEKYAVTRDGNATYNYFFYNRWATAEGKDISFGLDYTPTRIDIRSRPWAGYGGRTDQLNDYRPRAGSSYCSTQSWSIGIASFSATVPIQNCEETNPIIDATARSAGVIYDQGAVFSGRVRGTDFSMIVAADGGETPVLADYNYAKYCRGTYATCDGVLRKDSGW